MNALDIKINMLEKLYDFADAGKVKRVYIFSEHVIAVMNDIPQLKEKLAYATAINNILSATNSFEVNDLNHAKESVNAYKNKTNWP
jgi:hypothetical protein